MSNNFKVLIIANDFAGLKKGDVYVCRDNEYYVSNDIYFKKIHKDLLSKENQNLDFDFFGKAECLVKENLGITGDLYKVYLSFGGDGTNDYSIITCYVSKVIKLYKSLAD